MATRSQLNVSIDKELLKHIKENALNSGMHIGDYVNNLIKCYLTSLELNDIFDYSVDSRLNKVENRLLKIRKLLDELIKNRHDHSLTLKDEDAILYSKLLAKQFKEIAKNEMISTREAWNNFLVINQVNKIDNIHTELFQDILRGERQLTIDELIFILKLYGLCPIIEVLRSMTNDNLIEELESLSKKCILYAINN